MKGLGTAKVRLGTTGRPQRPSPPPPEYRYLRRDGSTKIEERPGMCERFNRDESIGGFWKFYVKLSKMASHGIAVVTTVIHSNRVIIQAI